MIRTSRHQSKTFFARHRSSFAGVLVLCALLLFAVSIFCFESHRLFWGTGSSVWFFDVGQGDATFLETSDGSQLLIDGGVDNTVLAKLGSVMWPWDRSIDAIVLTHADADHLTGLVEVLRRYQVQVVYVNKKEASEVLEQVFFQQSFINGAEIIVLDQGDRFVLDDWNFSVLWPSESAMSDSLISQNDRSLVLRAEQGDSCFLFMGDAEEGAELEILQGASDCAVLKAGHHGSSSSSSVLFLEAVQPEVVVVSAGQENRYGHPHEIVLERLMDVGAAVLRTDQQGDILFWLREDKQIIQGDSLSF